MANVELKRLAGLPGLLIEGSGVQRSCDYIKRGPFY